MHLRFGFAALILALAMGLAVAARAGQAVVVSDSTDIGFARGAVIEEGAAIKVPEGHTLSLIDANGKGMTIRGPYDGKLTTGGSAAPADPSILKAMQRILADRTDVALGAVRDASEKPQPPNPRLLDLGENATFCVAPGQRPELWRPAPTKRTTLTLTRVSTGERGDVDWPASQATVVWPEGLPIVDGESYQAIMPGALTRPRLLIKVVPYGETSVAAAEKLSQAACRKQALTMLESIAAGAH